MKLIHQQVQGFINEVDSKSPAPGGGSVSALLSTLGVSLLRMVGHLTVEKKKFLALDDDIKERFHHVFEGLLTLKEELIKLIDLDTEAFNLIMEAFQMTKTTDEEKAIRKKAIYQGTLEAIKVPQTIANLSLRAFEDIDVILTYGNQQTISDIGVAALAIGAGIEGACMNVLINVSGISDEDLAKTYHEEVKLLLEKAYSIRKKVLDAVYQKL